MTNPTLAPVQLTAEQTELVSRLASEKIKANLTQIQKLRSKKIGEDVIAELEEECRKLGEVESIVLGGFKH